MQALTPWNLNRTSQTADRNEQFKFHTEVIDSDASH